LRSEAHILDPNLCHLCVKKIFFQPVTYKLCETKAKQNMFICICGYFLHFVNKVKKNTCRSLSPSPLVVFFEVAATEQTGTIESQPAIAE
jgi:hypothetical protein